MKNKLRFLQKKLSYQRKKTKNNHLKNNQSKANLNLINLNQIVKKLNPTIINRQIKKIKSKKMTNNF